MKSDRDDGMVLVGRAIPVLGSPVGDIYVSETTLAQLGESAVRQAVRDIFNAGYAAKRRRREFEKVRGAAQIGAGVTPSGIARDSGEFVMSTPPQPPGGTK